MKMKNGLQKTKNEIHNLILNLCISGGENKYIVIVGCKASDLKKPSESYVCKLDHKSLCKNNGHSTKVKGRAFSRAV